MIPKKIHYCWFGGKEMPQLYKDCISTWKEKMPDFEIVEWNEDTIDRGVPYLEYCLKEKKWGFISDYIRMYALYEYGGIYLDVDMESVKSLEPFLGYDCFLGYEDEGRLNTAVLGSIPKHSFCKNGMNVIEDRLKNKKPILIGPEIANASYAINSEGVTALPWNFFYPYNPYAVTHDRKQLMHCYVGEDTYLIHHWGKSWKMTLTEKIMRRFFK